MNSPTAPVRILSYGEVLWDLLPTGPRVGGAPLNVAYHASQLGATSALISRIGNDELGQRLNQFMEQVGVDRRLVQVSDTEATGTVRVTFTDAETPSYAITHGVAWDFIAPSNAASGAVATADALVFGSLACRSRVSRETLYSYLPAGRLRVFDVNLRPPHYTADCVADLLDHSDLVKINEEELHVLSDWFGLRGTEANRLGALRLRYGLTTVVLTKGAEGAVSHDDVQGYVGHPGFRVSVADSIGAGDSFLAAYLTRHLAGATALDALAFAGAVGATVASRTGGTPNYTSQDIHQLLTDRPALT